MKLTQRFVLAAVLGAAASLTTACDRGGTPGEDRQNVNDFSTAPRPAPLKPIWTA
ncbi:hypothetical protein [Hymenobacter cellulosilyticus]|uniref:Uncharacterized protein n=1 Tax=Hymenobacter cellulosilyticus TaxID=2932248 RepID=A0A8T9Q8P0_9BACT|nr:hypothetical protein [Hymenobacter cellulosilyticus]UOQ71899.1 hypothetical protein MUN79_25440 [Hymenobacter cellulosilyticus]